MSIFRGFIAIDINVTPEMKLLKKEIEKTSADVKLVEPENIHITLKFLGDTNENYIDAVEQSIKQSVKDIKPFSITLSGTGVFPNQEYMKVIWIGIKEGGIIQMIAQSVDERLGLLGFQKEKKRFSPHLTIGRVKTARNKKQLQKLLEHYKEKEFAHQKVQSIILKKSELTSKGPIYSNLREVLL